MKKTIYAVFALLLLPAGGRSAILSADPTNISKVFSKAGPGDTIKAYGVFGPVWLQNRTFSAALNLDAENAVFADTLTIMNVNGLNVLRGRFGSQTDKMRVVHAVVVLNSNNITFEKNTFIGNGPAAAAAANQGILIRKSTEIAVLAGEFSDLRTGIAILTSKGVRLDNNTFSRMTSDGINIADSHFVTATKNSCNDTIPYPGAHPDCIQLWSVKGRAVQSDITLLHNSASGRTQGFTSFNPSDGGGIRISIIGNVVATSEPQGIACYNCVDSNISNNTVSTLTGSQHRTGKNIIGGFRNRIENNKIGSKGIR